jgi:hypothetical protein
MHGWLSGSLWQRQTAEQVRYKEAGKGTKVEDKAMMQEGGLSYALGREEMGH